MPKTNKQFIEIMEMPSRFPLFRALWRGFLDLAFPRDCAVKNEPVDNPPWRYLSQEALASLERVSEPYCEKCGYPFFGDVTDAHVCAKCFANNPVFQHGRIAVMAHGVARNLIHILKYKKGIWIAEDMARIMATTTGFAEFLEGAVLVPVPLHKNRRRWRGYNQAEVLAKHLLRLLPAHEITLETGLVRRVKNTSTQTFLGREERRQNVAHAFEPCEDAEERIDKTRRHIVIDDVFTTGATLNACCRVLADLGVNRISVAAFAHA